MKNINVKFVRIEKWTATKGNNILFITGLSGSGKSTLSTQVADNSGAVLFDLDTLEFIHESDNVILKAVEKKFPKYVTNMREGKGFNTMEYTSIVDYIITMMLKNKDRLYVVEGTQIYQLDHIFFKYINKKEASIMIVDAGMLDSLTRRLQRDGEYKDIVKLVKMYFNHNPQLRGFKNSIV